MPTGNLSFILTHLIHSLALASECLCRWLQVPLRTSLETAAACRNSHRNPLCIHYCWSFFFFLGLRKVWVSWVLGLTRARARTDFKSQRALTKVLIDYPPTSSLHPQRQSNPPPFGIWVCSLPTGPTFVDLPLLLEFRPLQYPNSYKPKNIKKKTDKPQEKASSTRMEQVQTSDKKLSTHLKHHNLFHIPIINQYSK